MPAWQEVGNSSVKATPAEHPADSGMSTRVVACQQQNQHGICKRSPKHPRTAAWADPSQRGRQCRLRGVRSIIPGQQPIGSGDAAI